MLTKLSLMKVEPMVSQVSAIVLHYAQAYYSFAASLKFWGVEKDNPRSLSGGDITNSVLCTEVDQFHTHLLCFL